jgi:hypothetical protein
MEAVQNVEAWALQGLQFDELSKIRVLAPDASQQAVDLREACTEFTESARGRTWVDTPRPV